MSRQSIQLSGPIDADVRLPGSKSITNRILVVGALADGVTEIDNPLRSDDTEAMLGGLAALGVTTHTGELTWRIEGRGGRFPAEEAAIDVRGSGTTARFLTAVAALVPGRTVLDGNDRMRKRPIGELAAALEHLGVMVDWIGAGGFPPLAVAGGPLGGGSVEIDASRSSQFVSALLMIAPFGDSDLEIRLSGEIVSRPYIDQTIEVMRAFGAEVEWSGDRTIQVSASHRYHATRVEIEGDASAAAYPLAAAAITGGVVRVHPIPEDSLQADVAFARVLEEMGCAVTHHNDTIELRGPRRLTAIAKNMNAAPDSALMLAVTAMFADGTTRITDVSNLELKESPRISALVQEIRRLGGEASRLSDGIAAGPGALHGAVVDPHDDHRLAMAFAVAGFRIPGLVVDHSECVDKTWPHFFSALEAMRRPLVVAVDGPGGVGKSTISRLLAADLGLAHLETGAMYRAATYAVLRNRALDEPESDLARYVGGLAVTVEPDRVMLDGIDVTEELRHDDVTNAVSRVSAIEPLRAALVDLQRSWLDGHPEGAVVEGRDIGTVVFPESPVKIYLTARPEIRAARRVKDIGLSPAELPRIAAELAERDRKDSSRAASPLRRADDAYLVDTSELGIDEVLQVVRRLVIDRPIPGT